MLSIVINIWKFCGNNFCGFGHVFLLKTHENPESL